MKPPPKLVGGLLVMNSVAIGRAIVVDAAIEKAIGEPLRESVRFATARAAELDAARGKPKEKGLDQDTWGGKNVTEMIPELEEQRKAAGERAKAKQDKRDADASNAVAKRAEKVQTACRNLLDAKKGKAADLSIQDLLVLIKWRDGTPPADCSKANKEAIISAWSSLQVPTEVLRAEAGAAAQAAPASAKRKAPAATKAAAKKRKKSKKADDSSDEEESEEEDEDEDEDEAMDDAETGDAIGGEEEDENSDEDEDADDEEDEDEDEEEDEEPTFNVERIVGQRMKGKKVEYQVEWEGEEWKGQYTWEPAANLEHNTVLKKYLAAQKAQKAQK